jgi:hypothetical protein
MQAQLSKNWSVSTKLFAESGKAQYILTKHSSNILSRVVTSDIQGRNVFKKRNKHVDSSPISIQDVKYWHLCAPQRPHRELGRADTILCCPLFHPNLLAEEQPTGRRMDRPFIPYHITSSIRRENGRQRTKCGRNDSECILDKEAL